MTRAMRPPDDVGIRFENRMLQRYGCGTVSAVVGARCATMLRASILTDGVFCSPSFIARMLSHWFGGTPSGFRVRPLSVGHFGFEVAHAGVAWEIVQRQVWTWGALRLHFSVSASASRPGSAVMHGPRVSMSRSNLPSLLSPYPGTPQRLSTFSFDVRSPCTPGFPRPAVEKPAEPTSARLHAPCNHHHAPALIPLLPPAPTQCSQSASPLASHATVSLLNGLTTPGSDRAPNLMALLSRVIIPTCRPCWQIFCLGITRRLCHARLPMQ